MANKKKRYTVVKQFTLRGKLREIDSRIYLDRIQKEILINKNLIK